MKVYELIGEKEKIKDTDKVAVDAFTHAQELYFNQDWDKAIKAFTDANELEDMFLL